MRISSLGSSFFNSVKFLVIASEIVFTELACDFGGKSIRFAQSSIDIFGERWYTESIEKKETAYGYRAWRV